MKKNILYGLLLMLSIGFAGCEDRLDIAKHGNMGSQEDFYKTDSEAEEAVASMYISMRGLYYNWFFTKNTLSDDVWCGGGQRGDNAQMENLNEYTFGSDNTMVRDLFSNLYTVIYKANLIIEKVSPDTNAKKRAVAEAKFFRAWANFELVTLYGTAPKVDHLLASDEYRQGNSTPEALWAFVESDLNEAIDMNILPSKTDINDNETGIRVTQEVAKAMLGKAYLFEKKYDEAATVLNQVINSGKYDLFKGDYDLQFHAENNNNCESMLELQLRDDTEQAWSQMTMNYIMQGWRSDKLNIASGSIASSELANGTYGFLNPRKSLYDAFVSAEGENGYRLKHTMLTYDQLQAYGVSVQPGVGVYGNEGYFMFKNRALKSDCVMDNSSFQVLQFTDFRIMRYAEVLLLAAEANLQAGHSDLAVTYINKVRTRAKENEVGSVTLDDIKTEKRLELCLESVRYQDLVRWGDAESVLGSQGKEIPVFYGQNVKWEYTNSTYGFKSRNNLLPIPLKETELNKNITQNTGW